MAKENRLHEIKDINKVLNVYVHETLTNNQSQSTLLGLAAYDGDASLVRYLLEAGANPNIPSSGYRQLYMPIHMTIWGNKNNNNVSERIEIINLLHKYNADLEWKGDSGYCWTPFGAAEYFISYSLGAELLKLGVNPLVSSSAYALLSRDINNLNRSDSFMNLACQEAKNKYESTKGYMLPETLRDDVLTQLQKVQFQYSESHSELVTIDMNRWSADLGEFYIWKHHCRTKVNYTNTDVFDLAETSYVGTVSLEDIFDSLV